MHAWEQTFKRAARSLSDREMAVLNAPIAPKPRWAVKDSAQTVTSSDPAVLELFGVTPSASGVSVTAESAMRNAAVYACTRLIAGTLATLPLPVYERMEGGTRKQVEHPVSALLNTQPTPRFTAATWMEFVGASILLRGDSFALIRRNAANVPADLIPIPSDQVIVGRLDGRLFYVIRDLDKTFNVDQDDVLHFPGFGFNGLRSMSIIRYAALQSIGTAMAMDQFTGSYFQGGTTPKFVLTSPNDLDEKQIDRLRDLWEQKYSGIDNQHKPLVLYGGMTATSLTLSAEDSQLLESRRFQVEDIARAFGIPPFMIGQLEKTTSFGSGVEHMGLGYLIYTMMPHLTRIQQEINRKLFRINRYFVEFNVNGLLQADAQGRAKYYREAIGGSQGPGWMTADEIRRLENMAPIDGGDERYVPQDKNAPQGASNAAA